MNLRRDVGRHNVTLKADHSDYGVFITPTLRELKQTAPYMHNGTIKTLKDVVAFYNRGGGKDANKDSRMKPLGLSSGEQANLVAFLEALSGAPLTSAEHVWKDKISANYEPIENWRKARN